MLFNLKNNNTFKRQAIQPRDINKAPLGVALGLRQAMQHSALLIKNIRG